MSSNVDFALAAPGETGVQPDHPAAAHVAIVDRDRAILDLKGRKRIAICGFASSSRGRIPFADPEWLIVGLNQLYRHIPRADVWFDIHRTWAEDNVAGTDHPRWIRECGIPVFMLEPYAEGPTTLRYPVELYIQKHGLDYFTSTVAFMLAWAIDQIDQSVERMAAAQLAVRQTNGHEPATLAEALALARSLYAEHQIGIFGIDMIVGTEYEVQKACVEFWLGIAEGRGIQVYIPPEAALLKQAYRYGYEKEPPVGLVALSEKRNYLGVIQQRKDKLMAELQTLDGAFQAIMHDVQVTELRSRGGQIPYGQEA